MAGAKTHLHGRAPMVSACGLLADRLVDARRYRDVTCRACRRSTQAREIAASRPLKRAARAVTKLFGRISHG